MNSVARAILSHFVITAHRVQDRWTWTIRMGKMTFEGDSPTFDAAVMDAIAELREVAKPAGDEAAKRRRRQS